jgi:FkbH-like protein
VLDIEAAGALLRGAAAIKQLETGAELPATRIAVLGSSTLDTLPNLLVATAVRRGLLPEIRLGGFNQWQLEVLAGAPELTTLRPRLVACLLDDSAIFAGLDDPVDVAQVASRCAQFPAELAAWVSACHAALGGLIVLATVPLSPLRRHSVISYAARARIEAAWSRMNAEIADLAASSPATVVLAGSDLTATAGVTFASARMRHIAGHAYAPEYLLAYAEELSRVAAADLGRPGKCLVLDLDGTLWGGVVGDDGPAGLRLGGGYPGAAHSELQTLAHHLSTQGVLLAISSKNDERVAAEALTTHPEMRLRPDSFAATRINWDLKADNVRAIAQELNIGPDALVFVDDNPVERDLMRRLAPEVTTVELPADPAGYADALAARGDFAVLAVTEEDRERGAMYRSQVRRRELAGSAPSLEQYLMGLRSQLRVEALTPLNTARIVQLFAKTNQFNLTGRRYGQDEVARLDAAGEVAFFGARLRDRFGDNGLVAAVALSAGQGGAWCIDNMVLSCRVFSRAVEDALIALILRAAARSGAPAVLGSFRQTQKNASFAGFYPRLGFRRVGTGQPPRYQRDLGELTELPPWIEIADPQEVFRVP